MTPEETPMRGILRQLACWLAGVLGFVAVLFLGDDTLGCSVSVRSRPSDTTTTTLVSDWGPADVPVEVGGDVYRCREMRWRGTQADGVDLRRCELEEAPDGR